MECDAFCVGGLTSGPCFDKLSKGSATCSLHVPERDAARPERTGRAACLRRSGSSGGKWFWFAAGLNDGTPVETDDIDEDERCLSGLVPMQRENLVERQSNQVERYLGR